jgi:cystathionine beta-lyase/cystathionine gamma-synthase
VDYLCEPLTPFPFRGRSRNVLVNTFEAANMTTANSPIRTHDHSRRPGTLCIHAGTYFDSSTGGACSPVFASTACAFPNAANENFYPRYFNTPNQRVVEEKIAALEHGEAAVVFGSGMAAISTLLFAHLKPGDHAVFQSDLYGGTVLLVQELTNWGVSVSFAGNAQEFAACVKPQTRLLYCETPSNPLLRVVDLAAIGALGRSHGALSVVDNTFATPINQTPLLLGMDVVVHSATKYLNGHSDLNAGLTVGTTDIIQRVRQCAVNHGGMLDAHGCSSLERGMKTLAVRVRQHNANAARIAAFLRQHPAVAAVNYPGLTDHPEHEVAARQMRGFGGMLSFELRDPARAEAVLAAFRLIMPALSLGGVESLVCIPSRTSHRKLSPEERQRAGISEGLVRLSVGIEDVEDLEADLGQALPV